MKEKIFVKYTHTCPICSEKYSIMIPFEEYMKWEQGELIAEAMVSLTAEQRKQILCNLCAACVVALTAEGVIE